MADWFMYLTSTLTCVYMCIYSSFVCVFASTHVYANAYEGQRTILSVGAQVSSTCCFRWGSLTVLDLHQVAWASCPVTTREPPVPAYTVLGLESQTAMLVFVFVFVFS